MHRGWVLPARVREHELIIVADSSHRKMPSQTRNHDPVSKQPREGGGYLGNQGSRPAAASRVDLTGASGRPIIRFPHYYYEGF